MKRFEEALAGWHASRLSQSKAALLLRVCERTFRRQIARYEADGLEGLLDKRISQASHRLAPVDEVMDVVALYRRDYQGWNVKHFHGWYQREHGGQRSYTWVTQALQAHGAVVRAKARGKHTASGVSERRYWGCWYIKMRARTCGSPISIGIWW